MEPDEEKNSAPPSKTIPATTFLLILCMIVLPLVGAWIGYTFAPTKVVEKTITIEKSAETANDFIYESEVDSNFEEPEPKITPSTLFEESEETVIFGDKVYLVLVDWLMPKHALGSYTVSTVYSWDLATQEVKVVDTVPGFISDIIPTKEGLVVASSKYAYCPENFNVCKQIVYLLSSDTGTWSILGEILGGRLVAYSKNIGGITTNFAGDAGCLSLNAFVYDGKFNLTDSVRESGCYSEDGSFMADENSYENIQDFVDETVALIQSDTEVSSCMANIVETQNGFAPECDSVNSNQSAKEVIIYK